MKWILADWGRNKRERFDAVASGLSSLGHQVVRIPQNAMRHREQLLSAIVGGDCDALITWQRFFPMQRDIRAALRQSGIATVYMDFGFVPHYDSVVFDTLGENAVSSWPKLWRKGPVPDPGAEFLAAAEQVVSAAATRAARLECPFDGNHMSVRRPFVFVPLQRTGDSVTRFDADVRDFGALVRRVLSLAEGSHFVIIKTHPLDRDLDLGVPDHVPGRHLVLRSAFGKANESACDWLLTNAALVLGINSNMLFRALCFGTPVIAAGRGWYSGSGVLHEVAGLRGLETLQVPLPDRDAQMRYIGFALSRQLLFSELRDPEKLGPMLERLQVRRALKPRRVQVLKRSQPAVGPKEASVPNIPRVFHQIWLDGEVPEDLLRVQRRMLELHPGWEHKLWTEQTLPSLINADEFDQASGPQYKADVARYELLAQFGGVYVDLDFLFLRSIDPLLENCDHLLAWESLGLVNNGIMAFTKNHPLAWALVRELPASFRLFRDDSELLRCRPQFVTRIVEERFPRAVILPPQLFFSAAPGALDDGEAIVHPSAVAIHLWNHRYARMDGRERPAIHRLLEKFSSSGTGDRSDCRISRVTRPRTVRTSAMSIAYGGQRTPCAGESVGSQEQTQFDNAMEWLRRTKTPLAQQGDEIRWLFEALWSARPGIFVEIGSRHGGSWFLLSHSVRPGGTVISIDLPGGPWGRSGSDASLQRVAGELQRRGWGAHVVLGDSRSTETVERVEDLLAGDQIDALFLDGDHTYGGVRGDWERYRPLLREGSMVAFHDLVAPRGSAVEVGRLWEELKDVFRSQRSKVVQWGIGVGWL